MCYKDYYYDTNFSAMWVITRFRLL
jgi:hypothetical protein